jgi:signal transduction histidine kinase
MISELFIILIISIILLFAALGYLWFGPFRKMSFENQRLRDQVLSIDKTIDLKVKERTRKLEEIRDSVSGYAVQKFELVQELELRNQEILEQKDYNAKQSEKLRIAYEEIKMLDAFRQQMVRMVVHDLKNPLNVILNLTDNDGIPSKPRSIIRQISFEMLELILNILEVNKFEEMKMRLEFENFNIHSLVKSLAEKHSLTFINASIQLKTNVSDALWVNADRHIVNRIMANLLGNAIKYTPAGGEIQINASQKEDKIIIEVKDNGAGIQKENFGNLFKMYEQGDNRKIVSYNSSTGIGLVYCKLAAEALGGQIGIDSEPGIGTAVRITLKSGIKVDSHENIVGEDNFGIKIPEFEFKRDDIDYLRPYIKDLQSMDICEVTKILELTKSIERIDNERVMRWKEFVEETLFSANEKRFRELIDI